MLRVLEINILMVHKSVGYKLSIVEDAISGQVDQSGLW